MKKKIIYLCLFISMAISSSGQDVGLSFSYFIPRHGDFSTPISPFSIRGLGFSLNKFLAIETGASLYRMSGLGMIDLPFESDHSLVGPNFTVFVPAELVIELKGNKVQLDIKGGGFFFYGFDQHLNYGNIDKALRQYENWDVANSSLDYENNPGFGYHFGGELTLPVTGQVSISLETNYLVGSSKLPLKGSYTGGKIGGTNETKAVDYANAKIDFTGLEFSIGLIFSAGGGGGKPSKAKRRR
jgi:hypothetical protein